MCETKPTQRPTTHIQEGVFFGSWQHGFAIQIGYGFLTSKQVLQSVEGCSLSASRRLCIEVIYGLAYPLQSGSCSKCLLQFVIALWPFCSLIHWQLVYGKADSQAVSGLLQFGRSSIYIILSVCLIIFRVFLETRKSGPDILAMIAISSQLVCGLECCIIRICEHVERSRIQVA